MNAAIIAEYYNVDVEAVVKWRLVDGDANVRSLINYGGGGIKVFIEPIENFDKPKEVESPIPAAINLDDMDYRQLQALAKERGIAANQSKEELVSELDIAYAFDEEE